MIHLCVRGLLGPNCKMSWLLEPMTVVRLNTFHRNSERFAKFRLWKKGTGHRLLCNTSANNWHIYVTQSNRIYLCLDIENNRDIMLYDNVSFLFAKATEKVIWELGNVALLCTKFTQSHLFSPRNAGFSSVVTII